MDMFDDTIVALSTPAGSSAVAVVRLTGLMAVDIVQKVWKGTNLPSASSHTVHYGFIMDSNTLIDEVMVAIFLAPKSFTTENMVEITCHGNMLIVQRVISVLIDSGARQAKAGEFTQRAFLNGRIDLSQAEAVADLIHSETDSAHQAALHQMRGGLKSKLQGMRTELLDYLALIELELDFGEEDVEFAKRDSLLALLNSIIHTISELAASFKMGNAIKNGVPVVIVGKPNAGKSTLLNALIQEDKAIVSAIAGTTRDIIEDEITIGGLQFRFIDTAGLRDTTDEIEAIGVSKAKLKMTEASLIIYLEDLFTHNPSQWQVAEAELISLHKPILKVGNKIDLLGDRQQAEYAEEGWFLLSAAQEQNIDVLKSELLRMVQVQEIKPDQTIITNQRHYQALLNCKQALVHAKQTLIAGAQTEIVAADLREALQELGSITGEVTNEDILGSIFGRFCIGK